MAPGRTGRSTRSCWRRSLIVDLQTIVSREIEPVRAGRRHGRLDSRRHQAQHHPRRGQAPAHPSIVQRAGAPAVDRRHQAPGDRAGTSPSGPRADRRGRGRHSADDQHARPGRAGRAGLRRGSWARRTSVPPSRSWGPKISAFSAKATCRSACSGWARSAPSASRRPPPRAKRRRRFTPSKYYPEPGPSIATGIRAMTAAVVKLLPPRH